MKLAKSIGPLVGLGLNALEARCYEALIAGGRATGYELARRTGKPAANVYKAVASLARKGAVAVRSGRTREFDPIPPAEFLGSVERRHAALVEQALGELESVATSPDPSQLWAIESVDAAFERARSMLRAAKKIAVIDAFPAALERIAPDLRKAARRGVKVWAQAYRAIDLDVTSLVVASESDVVLEHWKGEQMNLVVDGREVLLCLMTAELKKVVEAFWSNAHYLACMHHAGFLREHVFHQARAALAAGRSSDAALRRVLDSSPTFHSTEVPGQKALAAHLAALSQEKS